MPHNTLFLLLDQHNISYKVYNHEPAFTVEESGYLHDMIPGAHSKNLFLKDKKQNLFLVSVLDHKRVDLKSLSKTLGQGGLSFASAQQLLDLMHLTPGSVTPYGLLHDTEHKITYVLDKDFLSHDLVNFHPLRNDMTISVTTPSFLDFCTIINHVPDIREIPTLV